MPCRENEGDFLSLPHVRLGLGSRAGDRNSSARRPLSQLVVMLALCGSALAFGPTTRPAPSGVQFVDVTRDAGIDFHLTCGGSEKRYILESMCGGVAFLDYDNDGWLDILLVNGSTLEDLRRLFAPASLFEAAAVYVRPRLVPARDNLAHPQVAPLSSEENFLVLLLVPVLPGEDSRQFPLLFVHSPNAREKKAKKPQVQWQ